MKLHAPVGVRSAWSLLLFCLAASAQAVPEPTPVFQWNAIFDAYYQAGLEPGSGHINSFRAFDDRIGQPTLNMAKLSLDLLPKPVGFHFEAGAGHMFDVVGSSEGRLRPARYIEQAYVSFERKTWRGLRLDIGKFVTSAGAEVIDTTANWNYSRSLLFTFAIPFNHTGLRATMPLGRNFTAGVQVVSGWNNIVSGATYRTFGATGAWAGKKVSLNATVYGGPDENVADRGMRMLYDAVAVWKVSDRLHVYGNLDYGRDRPRVANAYTWSGYASAARLQLSGHTSLSARVGTLLDASGKMTGNPGRINGATLTGIWSPVKNFVSYLEFREDYVLQQNSRNRPGVILGTVLSFGAAPTAP